MARSFLFVPGNRPDRYAKACATRAHAVIIDLEDAVPPAQKASARAELAAWLSAARSVVVRVNAADTEWFSADIDACAHAGVAGVMLPKVERAADVARVTAICGDATPVYPLIESARGLWNVLEIAEAPGVHALVFGSLDFQADLNTTDDDLLYARSRIVLASRVAGVASPVDGVTPAIGDDELLRHDCLRGRRLGFGGKLCIHPQQVDVVNTAFAPTGAEMAWARRVVDAFELGGGSAVRLDGRMVDRPVLLQARTMLAHGDGT